MKTLEEVQAQFEGKNKAGEEVNILAYHPGQIYPIIGERFRNDEWEEVSFAEEGRFYSEGDGINDLIKKRPVLPKDILCEVWDSNAEHRGRRYTDGKGRFFPYGSNSLTSGLSTVKEEWKDYRVIENPPQPWFGGECPIPEGCEFRVRINGKWRKYPMCEWSLKNHITAYQILGEKESK